MLPVLECRGLFGRYLNGEYDDEIVISTESGRSDNSRASVVFAYPESGRVIEADTSVSADVSNGEYRVNSLYD